MLPSFTTEISEVPSTSHPLGLRGGGEGGTTPALGAVVNAICDALAELSVEHIEMPATPERVWQAIQGRAALGVIQCCALRRDGTRPRDRASRERAA
jgi:aerobic carbon-monoxide dehydrogenase large subunit